MKHGFSLIILLLVIPVIAVVFLITTNSYSPLGEIELGQSQIQIYNDAKSALKDDCEGEVTISSPVDVSLVSGALYPGQTRGNDYKRHGGFRFDNLESNSVEVRAPVDASLWRASSYVQSGEVQYLMFFKDDCGNIYKLDHLLTLTEKFGKALSVLPVPTDNSETKEILPSIFVKKGDLIAKEVGFEKSNNVFVDFGLYKDTDQNGLCFIDYLEEPEKSIIQSLPAGGIEGKTSDYCL
jgi:hypothetical protein